MIHVVVYGIPRDTPEIRLLELMADYQCMIAGISVLHDEQVAVYFESNLVAKEEGKYISIFVRGLPKKPGVTDAVMNQVAEDLGYRTKTDHYFPSARVECLVALPVEAIRSWSSVDGAPLR